MLLSQRAVLGGSEEGVRGPGASVQDKDNGRLGGKLLRHVEEHLDAGGVGAEVLDLLERGALVQGGIVQGNGGCAAECQEAGGEERGEEHCCGWNDPVGCFKGDGVRFLLSGQSMQEMVFPRRSHQFKTHALETSANTQLNTTLPRHILVRTSHFPSSSSYISPQTKWTCF